MAEVSELSLAREPIIPTNNLVARATPPPVPSALEPQKLDEVPLDPPDAHAPATGAAEGEEEDDGEWVDPEQVCS